jgi:hypothetical protein
MVTGQPNAEWNTYNVSRIDEEIDRHILDSVSSMANLIEVVNVVAEQRISTRTIYRASI